MIFSLGYKRKIPRLYIGLILRINQARGMYGLRREGENIATVKTQAAATGANITLVIGLFKLCWFILAVLLLFFKILCKVSH